MKDRILFALTMIALTWGGIGALASSAWLFFGATSATATGTALIAAAIFSVALPPAPVDASEVAA